MPAKITRPSLELDIEIDKGSTLRHTLRWSTGSPLVLVDLTGSTARMQIRADSRTVDEGNGVLLGDLLHSMTTENGGITLGGTNGEVEIFISDADSTLFNFNKACYDLEVEFSNTDVRRLVRGKFQAFDEKTI